MSKKLRILSHTNDNTSRKKRPQLINFHLVTSRASYLIKTLIDPQKLLTEH